VANMITTAVEIAPGTMTTTADLGTAVHPALHRAITTVEAVPRLRAQVEERGMHTRLPRLVPRARLNSDPLTAETRVLLLSAPHHRQQRQPPLRPSRRQQRTARLVLRR